MTEAIQAYLFDSGPPKIVSMPYLPIEAGGAVWEEGAGLCWCGTWLTPDQWHDTFSSLPPTCAGTGTIYCECGGDNLCVCHNHGENECLGCRDCEEIDDQDDCDQYYFEMEGRPYAGSEHHSA